MESFGFISGGLLLGLVALVAWALGAKANASVRQFREDHHENFLGRKRDRS